MNFILVSYSNASQFIYSLIGPPTMARMVQLIRSVFLSENFVGIGSLVFSGTQNGVRGPYGVMTAGFSGKKDFFQKWRK